MRAIEQRGYGDPAQVLHLTDAPTPTCADDQVLVRVRAASVNAADGHLVAGDPVLMRPALGGLRPRRIAGMDLAGVIEQVGATVTGLAVGDEVFGKADGAFAEYVAAPAATLARKPAGVSFEQAAALPVAGCTALHAVRRAGVGPGQRVLVIGASGGVGTTAVQLATHAGGEVTAVARADRSDLVRGLGAQHVIDHTTEDVTAGTGVYDVILQLGGTHSPRALRRLLRPRGTLVTSTGDGGPWIGPLGAIAAAGLLNVVVKERIVILVSSETTQDLDELAGLVDAGHLRPAIDSTHPLERVPQAVSLVKDGRPAGKVVITVAP
jgi:NADPH:quinone reductase-like Zn-dependent oxidoreductase